MPEQITLYNDTNRLSPFCYRVELALEEVGAEYTVHSFDVLSRPSWYTLVNPFTGKIPAITYGGPNVHPEEPSPLSFKLTESLVILDFLADVFPNSHLLPSVSDAAGRARTRFFGDAVVRNLDGPLVDLFRGNNDALEKVIDGALKVQALLPDPDAPDGGEYATGKQFSNADCAIAPLLAVIDAALTKDIGKFEPGIGKKLGEALAGERFGRLQRYKKTLWERESVKKVLDLGRLEAGFKSAFSGE